MLKRPTEVEIKTKKNGQEEDVRQGVAWRGGGTRSAFAVTEREAARASLECPRGRRLGRDARKPSLNLTKYFIPLNFQ